MAISMLHRPFIGVMLMFGALTTANAATVTTAFGGIAGNLGTSHVFGNIIATAFNSSGTIAFLNQRGSTTGGDNGIGVCNSVDDTNSCFGSAHTYYNEIDNYGYTYDWIRLDVRAANGFVTNIGLSSVDSNTNDSYSIWGNNTGIATFSIADFIAYGTGIGGDNPNVAIGHAFRSYGYYFITTGTRAGTSIPNVPGSDFLLSSITTSTITTVPLPTAVWLLGSGLLGLVGVARKRKAT